MAQLFGKIVQRFFKKLNMPPITLAIPLLGEADTQAYTKAPA